MENNATSTHRWTYYLVVIVLAPLAAFVGTLWGWMPGAATFALLIMPVCIATLGARRVDALSIAALASVAVFGDAFLQGGERTGEFGFLLPFVATACYLAVATYAGSVVGALRRRIERLEEQNTRYVRDLYDRDRAAGESELPSELQPQTPAKRPLPKSGEPETFDDISVNYALLLLTLQDIGRRISTSLDLETLIPTIVGTAKSSLKCRECRVYFWDSQRGTLTDALPARGRASEFYTPRPNAGMAAWVLSNNQILTHQDIQENYELQAVLEEEIHPPDAIAPLSVGGEILGVLVVDDVESEFPTFVRLLYILANIYALGIKNAQLFTRIEEMARRDGLTGLLNHASFQQKLSELTRNDRSARVSVIMSDIDHFKKFNDTWGHQAGDHVLREVARLWQAVLPDHAILARYGGEEFICALPEDGVDRARELAELLRSAVEAHVLDFEGQQLRVTSSFGVAEFSPEFDSHENLVKLADNALYQAKETGRNRVATGTSASPNQRNSKEPQAADG